MKYWLTTHFPHHVPAIPWHIFLKFKPSDARMPQEGQPVFFYETFARGPCAHHGAKAIVRHGIADGVIKPASAYGGGKPWEIACRDVLKGNPISFAEIVANTKLERLTGSDGLFLLDLADYTALRKLF